MSLEQALVIELPGWSERSAHGAMRWAREVAQQVWDGRRVIAVASPDPRRLAGDRAEGSGRLGLRDEHEAAAVFNGSARANADALRGALLALGVRVAPDPRERIVVRSRGHALDASPRSVPGRLLSAAFERSEVVVLAGGAAQDENGHETHLGEDGASLTAAFVADAVAVPRRVLRRTGDAAPLGERAARYLREHGVQPELTRVPGGETGGLRVAVLGRGPLARGVARALAQDTGAAYDLIGVITAPNGGASRKLLELSPEVVIDARVEVERSDRTLESALRHGIHAVAAGRSLDAGEAARLGVVARSFGSELRAAPAGDAEAHVGACLRACGELRTGAMALPA